MNVKWIKFFGALTGIFSVSLILRFVFGIPISFSTAILGFAIVGFYIRNAFLPAGQQTDMKTFLKEIRNVFCICGILLLLRHLISITGFPIIITWEIMHMELNGQSLLEVLTFTQTMSFFFDIGMLGGGFALGAGWVKNEIGKKVIAGVFTVLVIIGSAGIVLKQLAILLTRWSPELASKFFGYGSEVAPTINGMLPYSMSPALLFGFSAFLAFIAGITLRSFKGTKELGAKVLVCGTLIFIILAVVFAFKSPSRSPKSAGFHLKKEKAYHQSLGNGVWLVCVPAHKPLDSNLSASGTLYLLACGQIEYEPGSYSSPVGIKQQVKGTYLPVPFCKLVVSLGDGQEHLSLPFQSEGEISSNNWNAYQLLVGEAKKREKGRFFFAKVAVPLEKELHFFVNGIKKQLYKYTGGYRVYLWVDDSEGVS